MAEPTTLERADALHAAVRAYNTSAMTKQSGPSQASVSPQGQFQNSLLQTALNDLKTQFDTLKTATPTIAADLDRVHAEMQTALTTQYNKSLSGFKFDQARWDKNFDLTDPNSTIKTALNNIQTATAGTDVHQKILDSLTTIQTDTINKEMGRLIDSVNRQKVSMDVGNAAKAAYGANYQRVMWERIDNPKPDLDFENSTISGVGPGMGQSGLYHQEGSKFNIQIEGNTAKFALAEESWLSRKTKFQDRFHRFDNHQEGVRESMQSLAVLGGFKNVEYGFPGITADQFGKNNLKQMKRALNAAEEMLESREKTGMGPNPKFDFSQSCRELLEKSLHLSNSDKEDIMRRLAKYQDKYDAHERKIEQANTAAATPPTPTQPAAAATNTAAAASPLGGISQQSPDPAQPAPAANASGPAAAAPSSSSPSAASPSAANPIGGISQQSGTGVAAAAGADNKEEQENRSSGPRPGGPK